MKLSHRLDAIACYIKQQGGCYDVADIGSDHGFLPVYLIQEKIVEKVYACDVADGPIRACQKTIEQHGFQQSIRIYKGSGLDPLIERNIKPDIVCICGMGGYLIRDLLEDGIDFIDHSLLILQPNNNQPEVRSYLHHHFFEIIDEMIVKDMKHRYEIIVAKKTNQKMNYLEEDYLFGPILKKTKSPVFLDKWEWELSVQKRIIEHLQIENPKYQKTLQKIQQIEAMLTT